MHCNGPRDGNGYNRGIPNSPTIFTEVYVWTYMKNTSVITKTPYMKIIDIHHSNLTNNKEMKLEQLTFCFIHTLEVNKGLKDCYKTSEM